MYLKKESENEREKNKEKYGFFSEENLFTNYALLS